MDPVVALTGRVEIKVEDGSDTLIVEISSEGEAAKCFVRIMQGLDRRLVRVTLETID